MINIAVIGAGISGLTAAARLRNHARITFFEKSRGIGGRMSASRVEPFHFDHGTQFFTAETDRFQSFINPMIKEGIIQRWDARFVQIERHNIISRQLWNEDEPHYTGAPAMNAMAKYLAADFNLHLNTRVVALKRQNNGQWRLIDDLGNQAGNFDWVISSAPAEQAAALMPESFQYHHDVASARMSGCFSLMLGFSAALPLSFDAACIDKADIRWISVNSSKPGRNNACCLVVHSDSHWADVHMDNNRDEIMMHLCRETSHAIGHDVNIAQHKALHRWRYASIEKRDKALNLIDTEQKLAACGDWTIHGRVEAAFFSGLKVANAILKTVR